MRRREFIKVLGGAAVTLPLSAHAQQPDRMRRIGVLMSLTADDPEAKARLAAFVQLGRGGHQGRYSAFSKRPICDFRQGVGFLERSGAPRLPTGVLSPI